MPHPHRCLEQAGALRFAHGGAGAATGFVVRVSVQAPGGQHHVARLDRCRQPGTQFLGGSLQPAVRQAQPLHGLLRHAQALQAGGALIAALPGQGQGVVPGSAGVAGLAVGHRHHQAGAAMGHMVLQQGAAGQDLVIGVWRYHHQALPSAHELAGADMGNPLLEQPGFPEPRGHARCADETGCGVQAWGRGPRDHHAHG